MRRFAPKRRTLLRALPLLALARRGFAGPSIAYDAVSPGRGLSFPRDYGAHPGFRTEWWYVTGWLERDGAAPCGFQITFFRSRTAHSDENPSSFAPRQLLFAHAALSLPERGRLLHEDRAARAGAGGVRAVEQDTDVAIGNWSLARDPRTGVYAARITGRAIDLQLDFAPQRPPVRQGNQGYSQKGPSPGQASHYYSEPQLAVSGVVAADAGATRSRWRASGRAWLDHEWSSTLLDERAVGWDWAGINFDDGTSLMAFRIRTADGGILWSDAAWRDAQGRLISTVSSTADAGAPARWQATRWWTSPRSLARYPVGFTLRLGDESITLEPLMDDQEIDGRASTGNFYWEGAVLVTRGGTRAGRGYLELTGYARRLRL